MSINETRTYIDWPYYLAYLYLSYFRSNNLEQPTRNNDRETRGQTEP